MRGLSILKDGIKHMEKEPGREFGVFFLEACPRQVPRGAERAGPPDTAAEWPLPTTGSLLLPGLFLGSFSHSPPRNVSFQLSLEGSRERQQLLGWVLNRARSLLGRLETRVPTPATKPGAAAELRRFPLKVEDLMEREVRL